MTSRTFSQRYRMLAKRDASADGNFFYAVRTTGVYCRPSCAARTPRRENVAFYPTANAAERAGFRACKRCKPDRPETWTRQATRIAELCRFIERAEQPPSLSELSERARLSPHHLHRLFKAMTGLTPRGYSLAARAQRLREQLGSRASVTDAIYASGYGSSGRFYAQARRTLGMPPRAYQRRGAAQRIRFAVGECSLGSILVAESARGVCAILLGDDPEALLRDLQDRFSEATLVGADRAFERTVARVIGLVEAPRRGLQLPLDIRGTAFQERVWLALCKVPVGVTVSYAELARRIGEPKAARAVAGACARNPLAVAIPCHRVVQKSGALSGYRWGVERKQALLAREAAPA